MSDSDVLQKKFCMWWSPQFLHVLHAFWAQRGADSWAQHSALMMPDKYGERGKFFCSGQPERKHNFCTARPCCVWGGLLRQALFSQEMVQGSWWLLFPGKERSVFRALENKILCLSVDVGLKWDLLQRQQFKCFVPVLSAPAVRHILSQVCSSSPCSGAGFVSWLPFPCFQQQQQLTCLRKMLQNRPWELREVVL